jgi:hypothetical protein
MAAHQALERLMDAMPPQRSVDILRYKLPSQESTSSGTAVDGDVLCATIRYETLCINGTCKEAAALCSFCVWSVAPMHPHLFRIVFKA